MAELSMRSAAQVPAAEPLSAAAGARAILALSALGWCAVLGALLALI